MERADHELAKMHGLDVDEGETEHLGPIECPRCGYEEKREPHFCSRSGEAMRAEAAAEVRDREEDVKRDDAETEPGDEQQDEIDTLDELLAAPAVQEALLQLMDVG